ncbi:MAG: hypothetical protein LBK65_10790 [Tannerellaceae bacterium]|jgi:hypothetical protein|nr:hypothetical protein [Tannerellaceae bacterium]
MITDEMIKTEFISRTVSESLIRIYDTQKEVVDRHFNHGTGRLSSLLSGKPFSASASGLSHSFSMPILTYLRFLDMTYRGEVSSRRHRKEDRNDPPLYNRVVYGILYRETMSTLRYGFTEEIKEKITGELREADPGVASVL